MIDRQELVARKTAGAWLIQVKDLPVSDAQRQVVAQSLARLRKTVEAALPSLEITGAAPSESAPPAGSAQAPATSPVTAASGTSTSTWSLRSLRCFQAGLETLEALRRAGLTTGEGLTPGTSSPGQGLLAGLEALAAAFYLFEFRRMRDRLEEARVQFSQAITRLFLLRAALAGEAAGGVGPLAVVDQALTALEQEVMPGITGLLRRLDKSGASNGRQSQEPG